MGMRHCKKKKALLPQQKLPQCLQVPLLLSHYSAFATVSLGQTWAFKETHSDRASNSRDQQNILTKVGITTCNVFLEGWMDFCEIRHLFWDSLLKYFPIWNTSQSKIILETKIVEYPYLICVGKAQLLCQEVCFWCSMCLRKILRR